MSKKKKNRRFKGSGLGKSSAGSKSSNTKDSGYSKSQAEVVFALCEGEIEGLVDDDKSIFFDGTPVKNSSDSYNISNWFKEFRPGTNNQDALTAFGDYSASETAVSQEVVNGFPLTRTINSSTISSIIIRLGFVLYRYDDKGVSKETNLRFQIFLKEGNAAFNMVLDETKKGRYSSTIEFEYEIPVNNQSGTVNSFSIHVARITPTDTSDKYMRQLTLRSLVGITRANLRYPHTSVLAVKLDSDQFDTFPNETAIDLRGLIRIPIPTNATINTSDRGLDYTGIWDGTFKLATLAHSDPAWHLYNLLINKRYGLGNYTSASEIDIYSLYEISKYCNEFVPDGNGGYERRFSLNCVLQGDADAAQVIDNLVSVFRGFSFWNQRQLFFTGDKPATAIAQFTQADVEDGLFTYNRSGLKSRHSVAKVRWNDKNERYTTKYEYVDYLPSITKYGRREVEITAFGCVTQGQARRAGLAHLIGNYIQDESVSFKARTFAMMLYPGALIKVFDSHYADTRYGGLVEEAGINWVDLDAPIAITQNSGNVVSVTINGAIHERVVTNAIGTHNRLNVTPNFPDIPEPETNWIFTSAQLSPRYYIIVNRVPSDNELMHEILAIPYREDKYNAIDFEYALTIQPNSRQRIIAEIPKPISVLLSGIDYDSRNDYDQTLIISWEEPLVNGQLYEFIRGYQVEYSSDFKKWDATSVRPEENEIHVPNVPIGTYTARVSVIDLFGNQSDWVYSNSFNLKYINKLVIEPNVKLGIETLRATTINGRRLLSIIRDTSSNLFRVENFDFAITLYEAYVITASPAKTMTRALKMDDSAYIDVVYQNNSVGNTGIVRVFDHRNYVSDININSSITTPTHNRFLGVGIINNRQSLFFDQMHGSNTSFYSFQYNINTLSATSYFAYSKHYSTSTHNLVNIMSIKYNTSTLLMYVYQNRTTRNLVFDFGGVIPAIAVDVTELNMSTSFPTYEVGSATENKIYFVLRDATRMHLGVTLIGTWTTQFYLVTPYVSPSAWTILGIFYINDSLVWYWQELATSQIAIWKMRFEYTAMTKSSEYRIDNASSGIVGSTDTSWNIIGFGFTETGNPVGVYTNTNNTVILVTYTINDTTKLLVINSTATFGTISNPFTYYAFFYAKLSSTTVSDSQFIVRYDRTTRKSIITRLFSASTFIYMLLGADGYIVHGVKKIRNPLLSAASSEPFEYYMYFMDSRRDLYIVKFKYLVLSGNNIQLFTTELVTNIVPIMTRVKRIGNNIIAFDNYLSPLIYDSTTGARWIETIPD